MEESGRILLFGASTRAAAFSALRAGLRPWCVDLFADRDLRARCPVLPARGKYPDSFLDALRAAPAGPWLYTGGLENHPRLVREMSQARELWGNGATVLAWARNPQFIADMVRAAGLSAPAVCVGGEAGDSRQTIGRWLVKPIKSVSGRDIDFWTGDAAQQPDRGTYLQEFIDGEPVAAIFAGDGHSAQLLGVTRQLIGEAFCHATAFQYCGSVGPLVIGAGLRSALGRLGDVLTHACHLRGLFGIDGVLRDDVFWPVEVNPRYTASVEALEYATGLQALAWHRGAFDPTAPKASLPGPVRYVAGKAILLAQRDLVFPADGPWETVFQRPRPPAEMPAFADLPEPGERIKAGRPILTLLARGGTLAACLEELRQQTVALDRRLFGS